VSTFRNKNLHFVFCFQNPPSPAFDLHCKDFSINNFQGNYVESVNDMKIPALSSLAAYCFLIATFHTING